MSSKNNPTDPADDLAYREGYAQGRSEQPHRVRETRVQSNNLATGWLLGLLFAGLAGLGLAVLYFAQNNEPASNSTQPEVNITQPQSPEEPTVIEKTEEVIPDSPEVEVEIPDLPQNKEPNSSPGEGPQE